MVDRLEERVALVSVRPRFAAALLDGSKSVEVRRRRAHLANGALCLLYSSSPERALVGAIRIARTDTDGPDALWRRWGARTTLHRAEFDAYLAGCTQACAIVIASAIAFIEPIGLDDLRQRHHAFVPPQSYRFLATGEYASLLNGEAEQLGYQSDSFGSAGPPFPRG